MLGKIKKGFNIFLEVVFYIAYIVTIILGILDIFDLVNLFNMEQWTKILVMLFGTIGIVVLGDKRKMEQDFIPNISEISNTQNDLFTEEQKIKESVSNIENKVSGNSEVFYFSDKTQFYLFLTDLLLKLPTNARIDVTSFEKNYNISYSVGEDVHIEAFMTAWTQAVRSGKFHVRQLVHVTSPQDYNELKDRVYSFKDNWNYTISAMVGMPIAPFSDYIILNQEYVVIGMSNDISSPNNLSFGYAIKNKELAMNFQSYFNIYWSGQFSTIIKDKDEIKLKSLQEIGKFPYDIEHNISLKKYNEIDLALYHINDHNKSIMRLIENLNMFYGNVCYDTMQREIENKIKDCTDFINNKMKKFTSFPRNKAADIISKMIFNAKRNICAVSLDIAGSEFWTADEGEKVFQANIDVIARRKIDIERIFVCPKDKKGEIEATIKQQKAAGIKLHYTEYRDGMGVTFEDFLVIDGQALLVFDENEIKFSINPAYIDTYLEKFQYIKSIGKKQ